jgi:hypothetical protein
MAELPANLTHWQRVEIRPDSDLLIFDVPATSPVQKAGILVDSGADQGLALAPDLWRRWRSAHPTTPATLNAYFTPSVGLVVVEECWADEIEIGGIALHGVSIYPADVVDDFTDRKNLIAKFGLRVLARMEVALDGVHQVAYLRPLTDRPVPPPHNRLGAVFVPRDNTSNDLVARVAAGSPAEAAGLRDGDLLCKVDDTDISDWRSNPAIRPGARLWNQPAGTSYTLTILREGKTLTLHVTLRDILGAPAINHPAGKN